MDFITPQFESGVRPAPARRRNLETLACRERHNSTARRAATRSVVEALEGRALQCATLPTGHHAAGPDLEVSALAGQVHLNGVAATEGTADGTQRSQPLGAPSAAAAVVSIPRASTPTVRVAYLVPSNRTAQTHAAATLGRVMRETRDWYRDQLERNGYGAKTFNFETEADGATPKVWTVPVTETDAYLNGDLWGRTNTAASTAGVPLWSENEIWLLIPESHVMASDGSITGSVALGGSWGSGTDPGVAVLGSNGLAMLQQGFLTDDRLYGGLTIPAVGPYPLVQDRSFGSGEENTVSSVSSATQGALMHELGHALGLSHDFRNDDNFDGNVMGNGLRGYRGAVMPDRYTSNDTVLSNGQARMLSTSRYFNPATPAPERDRPVLSASVGVMPDGQRGIFFTASDAGGGLATAVLIRDGDHVDEIALSGGTFSGAFAPDFAGGNVRRFEVAVLDVYGNRTASASIEAQRDPAVNAPPVPFVDPDRTTVPVGGSITLDAWRSTDPDGDAGQMTVEWDLNGDGTFDTTPTTYKTYTLGGLTSPGVRQVRARLTDAAGKVTLSTPIGVRVLAAPTQTPFRGTPVRIASTGTTTVQAEDFDLGGQGIAYNDTTSTDNTGGAYRPTEGVDIVATTDSGGGYRLKDAMVGEWLEYMVDVPQSGTFNVDFRVSATETGGQFHLEVDGADVTGRLDVPQTGSFNTFQTVTKSNVRLTAGPHVLRLVLDRESARAGGATGGFNWLAFRPAAAAPAVKVVSSTTTYVSAASTGTNYGSSTTLQVGRGNGTSGRREAYLKFNLSAVTSVSTATLRLYGKLASAFSGGQQVDVYTTPVTSWTEGGLKWSNKPATSGDRLGSARVTSTSTQRVEIDLTAFLRAQKAAGKTEVTLVLKGATTGGPLVSFTSDDGSSDNRPALMVNP